MNKIVCGVIRSCLAQISSTCDGRGFSEENLRVPRGQVLDQEHKESLAPKEDALSLSIEERYFD